MSASQLSPHKGAAPCRSTQAKPSSRQRLCCPSKQTYCNRRLSMRQRLQTCVCAQGADLLCVRGRRTERKLCSAMRDVRAGNDVSHLQLFGSCSYTRCTVARREKLIVKPRKSFKPAHGQGGARVRP